MVAIKDNSLIPAEFSSSSKSPPPKGASNEQIKDCILHALHHEKRKLLRSEDFKCENILRKLNMSNKYILEDMKSRKKSKNMATEVAGSSGVNINTELAGHADNVLDVNEVTEVA